MRPKPIRTTMNNDRIIPKGNAGIEGNGVKLADGRVELGGALGKAFGVSKGNSMLASEMLTGARSGYLSTASTKYYG